MVPITHVSPDVELGSHKVTNAEMPSRDLSNNDNSKTAVEHSIMWPPVYGL